MSDKLDCGHDPTPTYYTAGTRVTVGNTIKVMTGDEVMFPGYAHTVDDRRICYGCADSEQAAEFAARPARFTAYLSLDGRNVTTWTGGVLARVTRLTRNSRQTFVRAVDIDGRHWAGIGPADSGAYVTLRPVGAA